MKTIEEAIVVKKTEILNGLFKTKDGLSWNETSELINELIELTQRWIPVNEELPNPKNPDEDIFDSKDVLLKDKRGDVWLAYYDHIVQIWNGVETDDRIDDATAWRPIEYK